MTTAHPADALPLPDLENLGEPSCYGHSDDAIRAARREGFELAMSKSKAEIAALRHMLACRVAGAALYGDDGELQDNSTHPQIDFKRDSVEEIERKLIERGIRRFVQDMNALAAPAQEQPISKAQEWREPVARVELMTTGGNVGIATRIVEIDDPLRERLSPGALLYDYPPPKSDEASLRAAAQAVVDWHGELGHDSLAMAELRAALAAQQKGGEV